MKTERLTKILTLIVFSSLVLSSIYVILRMIVTAIGVPFPGDRPESDYVLMLLQCFLGIFMMLLPGILAHRISIKVPHIMHIAFIIFLYCAIYLGEVRDFYNTVPNWDTVLHTFSGFMLGALGFSFVVILNNSDRVPVNLSPVFVSLFAFCFALSLGVFWELYEYLFDGLLGLNMQKTRLPDGTLLIGHAALTDTMKDLFVDAIGAFIISIVGFISLKHQKGWLEKMQIHLQRKT